ncbi:MAG: 4a-hydroxytetrahydrobiopterin dehydratase [Patescibacteria group bacterium]
MIAKNQKPKILSLQEIKKGLQKLPGWKYRANKISKQFEFKSFRQGIALVNKLAPFCDRIDHHPDIHINYRKILFELTRYDIGGKVTDRDLVVAGEIERLYRKIENN